MAEKRMIRVAAVQLSPELERPGGTVDKVLAAIAEAGAKGVRLAVFPETFVPWYPYFSFIYPPFKTGAEHLRLYDNAVVVPGPVTDAVAAAAKAHAMVVVLGVNERDHGTLYNTQLVFDADGAIVLKRRKITPTFHERMIWGQGDGSGLTVVETAAGRVGALACWEHYNPLARYALMAQHEEIHVAQFPGSLVGPIFADQIEVTIRHHALESGCFVVNATGWLSEAQIAAIAPDESLRGPLRGGCMTAIISPEGVHLAPPLKDGEGLVIADLDMGLILKRKRMMDSVGHYARPELLHLVLDSAAAVPMRAAAATAAPLFAASLGSNADEPVPAEVRDAGEAGSDGDPHQRVAIAGSAAG
ncbi:MULTISPECIES: Nit6803 family nitrilase [Rhodomicrobium]|uniref:Nit6803 family nitrilase n=1 Tax=Rhodomicrobium TaxID=1068 RepID=UPI000B4B28A7|nr:MULTISPECIES: Nit6803 family nitrilase [Rhodomicrobium]